MLCRGLDRGEDLPERILHKAEHVQEGSDGAITFCQDLKAGSLQSDATGV